MSVQIEFEICMVSDIIIVILHPFIVIRLLLLIVSLLNDTLNIQLSLAGIFPTNLVGTAIATSVRLLFVSG